MAPSYLTPILAWKIRRSRRTDVAFESITKFNERRFEERDEIDLVDELGPLANFLFTETHGQFGNPGKLREKDFDANVYSYFVKKQPHLSHFCPRSFGELIAEERNSSFHANCAMSFFGKDYTGGFSCNRYLFMRPDYTFSFCFFGNCVSAFAESSLSFGYFGSWRKDLESDMVLLTPNVSTIVCHYSWRYQPFGGNRLPREPTVLQCEFTLGGYGEVLRSSGCKLGKKDRKLVREDDLCPRRGCGKLREFYTNKIESRLDTTRFIVYECKVCGYDSRYPETWNDPSLTNTEVAGAVLAPK